MNGTTTEWSESSGNLTVLITTKNRRDELRKALLSTFSQDIACQVLVLDDGSTDGTADMVRSDFPQVQLHREEQSLGVIRARNKGIALATTDVVVVIDDDCIFSSPTCLRQAMRDLDQPRVGVVTMPLINANYSPRILGKAPDETGVWIAAQFQGGANAVKRAAFLAAGGMRGEFNRQCEETDLTLRLMNAGLYTRLGNGEPVLHYESPVRDRSRIIYFQTRNNLLICTYDVPLVALPVHLCATTFNVVRAGFAEGYYLATLRGLAAAVKETLLHLGRRRAVSLATYRLFRRLRRGEEIDISRESFPT